MQIVAAVDINPKRLLEMEMEYGVPRENCFLQKIKECLQAGVIGDIVSVQAIEGVAYWHQAHSFVRGNWRNQEVPSQP